jgi:PKD repeat protein
LAENFIVLVEQTNYMNKPLFSLSMLTAACLLAGSALAQNGRIRLDDPNENFYQTQKRLNKHFREFERESRKEHESERAKKGEEQEAASYEVYKRWESYMAPRVYPSGDKTLPSRAREEYKNYLLQNAQSRQGSNTVQSSTWQPIGPFGDPTGGNAGRINAVRFDPSNANGLWICTPDGGLWSSANSGGSWNTNTDQLTVIGNTDVAFDPTNSQIMYMATGDGDAADSYSTGVLKSTDGGATWNATGLSWQVSQGRRIYRLLINPLNANVLLAATTNGVYRTTNAGATWNIVQGSGTKYTDMEYKPGDTTTVYAVAASAFYKSTNGGASFTNISSGLPTNSACDRLAIAVTPANASYVYVVGSNASNDGFYAFYQSTNSGTSFTQKATSPNLLGWSNTGNDTGGQGWYTLSIAASPTDANEVVVGGVNIWRTTNGGTGWTIFAHWTGTGAPYAHADIHDLIYQNGTTVYAGTDGGIFVTTNSGGTWSAVNGNMNIAEIYKIGLSKSTYSLAITGHQDNGTNIYAGGWGNTMGGDGMDCFIDWSNDQVMYGEQYQGSLNRTTNGGGAWTGITTGLTGTGAWVTPWHQDPLTANTIYCGYQQLFKSTNQGTSWSQIGTMSVSNQIVEFAVAPSNPQVIYVINGNTLFKTTNGGTSWTNVTGTIPTGSAQMTWVAVEDDDPNSVWVTLSGYSSGNKIFMSSNGGTSWTNYSTGLPNLPANCVTYWNGTKDALYVGCDVGIFYRDSTMSSWVSYSTGLPNVSVRDLAIFYPMGKLRAATFGRGVWEADLYNNGTLAPIANFSADKTFICAGTTVNFTDLSTFNPTSWSWTFQSGNPATSTQQNPSVVYTTPGTYSVSLTATNGNGSNTMTQVTYITVSPIVNLPLQEGFQNTTFPPANWQNYDANTDNLKWKRSATVGRNSTASMYYDNYNLDASGTRDEMRTPKYDFSNVNIVKLFFDVAYSQYDLQYSDSLAVMVSSDCGLTYTQVYMKGGTTLATAPNDSNSIFTPTAAQWRTDTVYLNAYAGMSNVMVSFQNRGHYGQAIYVDNINIVGINSAQPPTAQYTVAPVICTAKTYTFTDQSSNAPTSWSWTFQGGTPGTSTAQNPTISYAAAGTYTVALVASNSNGSSSPLTQTVTVNATPTVAASGGTTICSGTCAILSAGGATTYVWSPGGAATSTVNVCPTTTKTYTVTGTSSSCSNTSTVTLQVNPKPTVTASASQDTVCIGSTSSILTAGGAVTYSWSPAAGLSATTGASVTANPTVTTTYTVTGVDVNGCVNMAYHTIVASSCSGINSNSLNGQLSLYPNPGNGTFVLEIPAGMTGVNAIEIRNSLGQLVYADKLKSDGTKMQKTISLGDCAKGIYTFSLSNQQNKFVRKIIVE